MQQQRDPPNGPWRPRYAPVYDPHTDPWHEDEEDDPLPAVAQSYSGARGNGTCFYFMSVFLGRESSTPQCMALALEPS